jgi:biofilm PGA synthesis protein PgaD
MTAPTRPRTGPGQNTTVIFDRPDLQARRHRWAYSALTLLAWGIWMYLWLPVVTLLAWYLGIRTFIREMVIPDPRTMGTLALAYLVVVLIMGAILVVWSQYNLRRFRGQDRRRASLPVSDEETVRWFQISPEILERFRSTGSLTVEHDGEGRIVEAASESRTDFVSLQDRGLPTTG